ncbi:type VII secretion-associated serine protease mycosin (plasmid) [Mycobacterium sp. djl-10]|nr:type VII secretion-associated serine protease mycosin [Mycobacterium sp. djl-10]
MSGQRASAVAAVVMLAAAWPLVGAPSATAITPPVVDPLAVPDGTPRPDEPMQHKYDCIPTGLIAGTDPAAVPGSQAFMNLPRLWESAGRGAGVSVALIDTGVWPNPRLPRLRGGGDFIMDGGDGLQDCDAHGTTVAAIIASSPAEGDGLVGVAPEVELISIRQSSQMFTPVAPSATSEEDRRAGTVSSLARAVVAAANTGARVINMSIVACIPVLKPVDQTTLGAALRYAAVEKDAVIVAAAGNTSTPGCAQNPNIDATSVEDPRNWNSVVTISTPAWFSDYVLSVSATNNEGQPAVDDQGTDISVGGPWVGVGAPGLFVEGVNQEGNLINGTHDTKTNSLKPMSGTSFSAAYVSGLAALIRAKYPDLPAHQVINRIKQTAHSPAAVVDNRLGYGAIDPVAALNYDVPPIPAPRENLSRPLGPPQPEPEPDRRPMVMALVGTATLTVLLGAVLAVGAMSKSRRG